MEQAKEIKQMVNIVSRWGGIHIESTAAANVNYSGDLYNVEGSTYDPHIGGSNWKPLLISRGINGDCYVTNEDPEPGASHPGFNVGGHMTPNSSGDVADGGTCYLMPLCHWHNNPARDGVAFSHTETSMLQLSGYMQDEMAVTFMARLPSEEPFSLMYYSDGEWQHKNLPDFEAADIKSNRLSSDVLDCKLDHYVLLKRAMQDGQTNYVVHSTQLPD